MARNRMLNPEFWLDEEIAGISPHARLFYMGLWGICDDNYATFPDKHSWLKVQVFPYESVSIPQLLSELEKIGKIIPFEEKNEKFWFIKNFFKYQRVEKPSLPKYPKYKPILENSRGVVGEESGSSRSEEKRSEEKRSKVSSKDDREQIVPTDEDGNPIKIKPKKLNPDGSYGKPEINRLTEFLKSTLGLKILDGSIQENRRYCQLCLTKFRSEAVLQQIILAAAKSDFWKTKVTGWKNIFYNGVKIAGSIHDKPKQTWSVIS